MSEAKDLATPNVVIAWCRRETAAYYLTDFAPSRILSSTRREADFSPK